MLRQIHTGSCLSTTTVTAEARSCLGDMDRTFALDAFEAAF